VQQPGPMRAFYERIRARRGFGIAIVATAHKLAVLFWCPLTRGENHAHQQPSLTAKKLRKLELPPRKIQPESRPLDTATSQTNLTPADLHPAPSRPPPIDHPNPPKK